MNTVFLSLGGNQGDRLLFLNRAIESIGAEIGRIVKRSSVYETEPWGSDSPSSFLNMVVIVETSLPAPGVLEKITTIEKKLERNRVADRNADRTIDIDILFFNDEIIHAEGLEIPHPRLHLRNFVLAPLVEIATELVHPTLNRHIEEIYRDCDDKLFVRKIEPL